MFHVEQCKFGVYVHVPFCVSRCGYCDFCRVTDMSLRDGYLSAVAKEMEACGWAGRSPRTVYVGGGTPSCLGVGRLGELLSLVRRSFDLGEAVEFTVECNPEDVTQELAAVMTECGVNRVSMGAQSLSDSALRVMGRRHDARRVYEAVTTLEKAGVTNISVDCIFGLPKMDGYSPYDDFERFAALGVTHLSAYALQYEPGSRFTRMAEDGKLVPATDDEVAEQYDALTAILARAGYEHYEISNYARPGFRAVHNSSYWDRTDYLGFGPGASSLKEGVRWTNTYDVKDYIGSLGQEKELVETLGEREVAEEVVMLGLRTSRGVNPDDVPTAYRAAFDKAAAREKELGNVAALPDGRLRIPEERWMVSDMIIRNLTDF